MKKLLCAVGLMAAHSISQGADWRQLFSNGAVEISMDANSISKTGQTVKAWLRLNHPSGEPLPGSPGKTYHSTLTLRYFNCRDRTTAIGPITYYTGQNATGEPVLSLPGEPGRFDDVRPGTGGENFLDAACGKLPLPKPQK